MAPAAEYSTRAKEAAIWALARQNPDFEAFYDAYKEKITLTGPLPAELVDGVIAVAEKDPGLAPAAKRYQQNAQAAATFAITGLSAAGILIAALFLLGTHIKIYRSQDGKWEFLVEHRASSEGMLEKVAQALSGFLNSSK